MLTNFDIYRKREVVVSAFIERQRRYPDLLAYPGWDDLMHSQLAWGFDCGPGWLPLIDIALATLNWGSQHAPTATIHVRQVKKIWALNHLCGFVERSPARSRWHPVHFIPFSRPLNLYVRTVRPSGGPAIYGRLVADSVRCL